MAISSCTCRIADASEGNGQGNKTILARGYVSTRAITIFSIAPYTSRLARGGEREKKSFVAIF